MRVGISLRSDQQSTDNSQRTNFESLKVRKFENLKIKIAHPKNGNEQFLYCNLTSESNYSAAGVSVAGASAVAFLLRRVRPAFLAAFSLSMFSL